MMHTSAICMIGYKLIVTIDVYANFFHQKSIENSILYCLSRLYAYKLRVQIVKIFHQHTRN